MWTVAVLIGAGTTLDKAVNDSKIGLKLLALLMITMLAFVFRNRR